MQFARRQQSTGRIPRTYASQYNHGDPSVFVVGQVVHPNHQKHLRSAAARVSGRRLTSARAPRTVPTVNKITAMATVLHGTSRGPRRRLGALSLPSTASWGAAAARHVSGKRVVPATRGGASTHGHNVEGALNLIRDCRHAVRLAVAAPRTGGAAAARRPIGVTRGACAAHRLPRHSPRDTLPVAGSKTIYND